MVRQGAHHSEEKNSPSYCCSNDDRIVVAAVCVFVSHKSCFALRRQTLNLHVGVCCRVACPKVIDEIGCESTAASCPSPQLGLGCGQGCRVGRQKREMKIDNRGHCLAVEPPAFAIRTRRRELEVDALEGAPPRLCLEVGSKSGAERILLDLSLNVDSAKQHAAEYSSRGG